MSSTFQVKGEILVEDPDGVDGDKPIIVEAQVVEKTRPQMTIVQNPQVVQAQPMVTHAVVTPAPQMVMNVQIPPNISSGMTMIVQSPEGLQFQVVVPQGVSSGATIQVQVPQVNQGQSTVIIQNRKKIISQNYCGPISCCISVVLALLLPPACLCVPCCPCDVREVEDMRTSGNQTNHW